VFRYILQESLEWRSVFQHLQTNAKMWYSYTRKSFQFLGLSLIRDSAPGPYWEHSPRPKISTQYLFIPQS